MKLFAAGPEPAELQRCAAEGLCEGLVVLGSDATDPSQEATASLLALGRAFSGPILVEVGPVEDVASLGRTLASLGSQFAARIPFAPGGAARRARPRASRRTPSLARRRTRPSPRPGGARPGFRPC